MNYLILAMKRSGHHAITEWIKSHTDQRFYNNCCFGWKDKKLLTMKGKNEAVEGVANIEDFNMDYWEEYDFPSFPFVQNGKVIIVMRNYKNWLASCYKRKFQNNEEHKDVYRYLDRPYINDSKLESPPRILLYNKMLNCKFYTIWFDDFISQLEYRKKVAIDLGLEWKAIHDLSTAYVSDYGNGSSFDWLRYDGRASEMEVNTRYKEFENDEEFKKLLERVVNV